MASADALISDALAADSVARTPWRQIWMTALTVAVIGVTSWEAVLRAHDRGPSVRESPADWATRWSQIVAGPMSAETVAILGDSRVIFGVRPSILESELGLRPVSLAISASDPLPVLERLCERGFAGRVLVGVRPGSFFTEKCVVHTEGFLDEADQLGPAKLAEASLRQTVESHVSFRRSANNPRVIGAVYVANGFELEPSELVRDAHGHGRLLRRPASVKEVPPAPEIMETDAKIERYAHLLTELRSRGGDLWFVHTPSSGAQRDYEETHFPREEFWDVLLERTGAVGIHFEDLDYERALYCPDEDHLDSASSEAFTRAVANELRRCTETAVRDSARK